MCQHYESFRKDFKKLSSRKRSGFQIKTENNLLIELRNAERLKHNGVRWNGAYLENNNKIAHVISNLKIKMLLYPDVFSDNEMHANINHFKDALLVLD